MIQVDFFTPLIHFAALIPSPSRWARSQQLQNRFYTREPGHIVGPKHSGRLSLFNMPLVLFAQLTGSSGFAPDRRTQQP
jgi:hypothetical protein